MEVIVSLFSCCCGISPLPRIHTTMGTHPLPSTEPRVKLDYMLMEGGVTNGTREAIAKTPASVPLS